MASSFASIPYIKFLFVPSDHLHRVEYMISIFMN